MSWAYDLRTGSTGPQFGLLRREQLEEAIDALSSVTASRSLIIDVLTALSGLSWKEVAFTVDVAIEPSLENYPCSRLA